jgi:glyoxylase-like metal-dependent hydrolase (beta-lactamase superfamily II)
MQSRQWYRVRTGPEAEVWSHVVEPGVHTCNSFVIRTPTHLFVVDPGGTLAQAEEVFSIVRFELQQKTRPVYVCLTHCHIDHVLGFVTWSGRNTLPDLSVVLHEAGCEAWQTADRELTQAEILEQPMPAWVPSGLRVIAPGKRNKRGPPDFCIENQLEVFLAPGHCPDAVCYRLGEVLIVGDLLVATAPLVAGVKGWDGGEMVKSLQRVGHLVEECGIQYVGPGHGGILERTKLAKILSRAANEAESLTDIEPVNVSRVKSVSGQAHVMFDDLLAVFAVIQSRIERLAQRLQSLEETSAARQIRQILDSEQVIALLGEFRLFAASLRSGAIIAVQLALKSVQIVPRILRLLEYDHLRDVLDPSLLRYTRSLLTDFLSTAKGLRVEEEKSLLDLSAWTASFVQELKLHPSSGLTSDDIPDDEEGFRNHLIKMIAHVPVVESVPLKVKDCPDPVWVSAVPDRLHDAVKRLLEICVEIGARQLTLSVEPGQLSILAKFSVKTPDPETVRWQGCPRSLALAGANLNTTVAVDVLRLVLRFL